MDDTTGIHETPLMPTCEVSPPAGGACTQGWAHNEAIAKTEQVSQGDAECEREIQGYSRT